MCIYKYVCCAIYNTSGTRRHLCISLNLSYLNSMRRYVLYVGIIRNIEHDE